MMAACAVIMFLTAPKTWMAATGTAIMAVVAAWLWRRPEPPLIGLETDRRVTLRP